MWARSHWQGNLSVVLTETYWYKVHRWTCYSTYVGSLLTPAFLIDGLVLLLACKAMQDWILNCGTEQAIWIALICWIMVSKLVKLFDHFGRFPCDVVWIPVLIFFSYCHGLINMWALVTMCKNAWGRKSSGHLARVLRS